MIYKIVVDKQSRTNPSSEKREYTIDIEELRVKGDIYDSLVITKDEDYVMRRLSLSELQVLSVLEEPIKQPLPDLNIELFEGDNYIYLLDMTGNKFYAEYIVKNDFTELYVTTNEMNSAINQSASQIELSVNQKLTDYSTTEEMNASINIKADEINQVVSKKVGEDEIISKINQSAEAVSINASKVNLSGYVTISNLSTSGKTTINGGNITTGTIDASKVAVKNLSADNITSGTIKGRAISGGTITGTKITNGNNFSVDASGNMTCNNAKIEAKGGSNTGDSSGLNLKVTGDNTYQYSGFAPGFGIVRNTETNYINFETKTEYAGLQIRANNNNYISNTVLGDMEVVSTMWHGPNNSTNVSSSGITTPKITINNEGQAMYGKNAHKYRCNWTGSQLQFWVDETNVGTLSDKRLKTEIQDIDEDFIKAIKEVEMKQFKIANRNGLVSFGILAQDLIEIFQKYNKNPFDYEIVQETQYRTDDDTIYYTINYEQYLILKAKAQQQEIKELQEKDKQKDNLIQSLIERIENLEKGANNEEN